ncbi:hypothetical protein CSOJ01_11504 [Colletotrichum sojae]|uniref:Uncharacterized protein n=1 Tax=Colletotrichum sojae TaxID=2175907 RepID=A0A8H6IXB0_9PEZI|nr:hypothetical protein CSOJ01_11504 [Colletotrichum sojae]
MEAGCSTTQGGAPYRPSSRRLRGGGLIERYVVTVVLVFGNNDPVWARRCESITKKHQAAATQHRPATDPATVPRPADRADCAAPGRRRVVTSQGTHR